MASWTTSACFFLNFYLLYPTLIFPFDITQVKTHLPLNMCWAIGMYKLKSKTLQKNSVHLGGKEACTGLAYVCLKRAKRIVQLTVESIYKFW